MARKGARFSRGTLLALIAAVAVLLLSAVFLWMVSGSPTAPVRPAAEETAEPAATAQPAADRPETPTPPAGSPQPETTALPQRAGFTLAAAGTLNVPRSIREFAQGAGHYDFSTLFLGLGASLSDADLSVATLETLTDATQPYDAVNAPPEFLDALRALGLDALCLGSEHALDKGYEGLDHTLSEFVSRGIDAVGVRRGGDFPGTMIGIRGNRVALLGCTRHSTFAIDYYRKVHGRGVTLVGAHTMARPKNDSSPGWWTERDDAFAFLRLLALGRIALDGFVEEVHPLSDAPAVYTRLAAGGPFPNVQFDWTSSHL